ncbi:MAG: exosortase/archaeosortase family protein [Verrucomicrobiota bacterium]
MPHQSKKQKLKTSRYEWAFLALCATVWVDFLEILRVEWDLNPVYEFGYLVPPLVAYLAYRRIGGIPLQLSAIERPHLLWIIGMCLCLIFPIHLVRLANPDWRAVYWAYCAIALGITFAIFYLLYGPLQTRRILPATGLMLFAMPWPSGIEATLTQTLMAWVSEATVVLINSMGIPAIQQGQIIALPDAFVGVEEACSGVRSFQSSLMAAWFFGEYYRFSPIQRISLLSLAPIVAFIVNIGRTLALTHSVHLLGTDDFEFMHDSTGWFSTCIAFLLVLGVAVLFHITFSRWRPDPKHTEPPVKVVSSSKNAPNWIWIAILFIPISRGVAMGYYLLKEDSEGNAIITHAHWDALDSDVKIVEIPADQRALLRYSEGTRVQWRRADGLATTSYFFHWNAGRISSFAGIHSPEICLPSVGHLLVDGPQEFRLPTEYGTILLKGYQFDLSLPGGRRIPRSVFFGVWDSDLRPAPVRVVGAAGRLKNVLKGERIRNRTSVQLIVTGSESLQEAWPQARADLKQFLRFSPISDT